MADVRAMLRAERAARAPPTKAKAPPRTAVPDPNALPTSKKRKASPEGDEEDVREPRKRARSDASQENARAVRDGPSKSSEGEGEEEASEPTDSAAVAAVPQAPAQGEIDEDEWAAFERDVATPPPQAAPTGNAIDALNSSAAISAAPVTAEELAAQAREELSTQRGKRDAELEGEKEDAEQALAEEFEEMEALEARVKKLRERRESLRKQREGELVGEAEDTGVAVQAAGEVSQSKPVSSITLEEVDEEEDEEYWDDWHFRGMKHSSVI